MQRDVPQTPMQDSVSKFGNFSSAKNATGDTGVLATLPILQGSQNMARREEINLPAYSYTTLVVYIFGRRISDLVLGSDASTYSRVRKSQKLEFSLSGHASTFQEWVIPEIRKPKGAT